MKLLFLSLALPLLTGCTWGLQVIKEVSIELTSHYGLRRATVIVEVPANFSASYRAYYEPRTPEECQSFVAGTGGHQTRSNEQRTENIQASPFNQTVKFKVPLTFHIGACTMNLSTVVTSIESVNKEGDSASLKVVSTSQRNPKIPASEKLIRRLCGPVLWVVPEHAKVKKLSVYLQCRNADQQWSLPDIDDSLKYDSDITVSIDELKRHPVRYVYRRTPNVRPRFRDNWREFDNGWKACVADWDWLGEESCDFRDPQFTKFLMPDGRQCTIYPGCTE
jgi:hypothetical protein